MKIKVTKIINDTNEFVKDIREFMIDAKGLSPTLDNYISDTIEFMENKIEELKQLKVENVKKKNPIVVEIETKKKDTMKLFRVALLILKLKGNK